jgi:acyl-CoA thioesterase-1
MTLARLLKLLVLAALLCPAAWGAERTIVVVGDSLSSGYGLAAEQSWVSMLEERLAAQGYGYQVVNASIAGDTSAGGRARLPRLLDRHSPAIVIVQLGGNDGLRGQPVATLRDNLAAMLETVEARGSDAVLVGIRMPPNYGATYAEALAAVYPELAQTFDVPVVEFLLEGVALDATLMQADGIHANAAGQRVMLDTMWHALSGLLQHESR